MKCCTYLNAPEIEEGQAVLARVYAARSRVNYTEVVCSILKKNEKSVVLKALHGFFIGGEPYRPGFIFRVNLTTSVNFKERDRLKPIGASTLKSEVDMRATAYDSKINRCQLAEDEEKIAWLNKLYVKTNTFFQLDKSDRLLRRSLRESGENMVSRYLVIIKEKIEYLKVLESNIKIIRQMHPRSRRCSTCGLIIKVEEFKAPREKLRIIGWRYTYECPRCKGTNLASPVELLSRLDSRGKPFGYNLDR